MKRTAFASIILLSLFFLSYDLSELQGAESTRQIKDMAGNLVTIPIPENIQRAAIIHTPVAQVAYILGAQDKLCAVTRQVKMLPFISRLDPHLEKVSTPVSGWEVNIEELLASRPDIIIGSDMQLSKIAKTVSIPLLYVGNNSTGSDFENQKAVVRFFGDVFGKKERAENYCRFLDESHEKITGRITSVKQEKRPRVLIASEPDHSGTYGKGSYMQEWLTMAGCRNAAEALPVLGSPNTFSKVSPEQMLAWDPDIILISAGSLEELEKVSVWSHFRAVQNKKVYRIPVGIFIWNRPTAEGAALFPLWMATTAYPELFSGLTSEYHIKKFWKDILKYDLTDNDVYEILHPMDRKFK
jgi:iron complex transport system substrate-binding protein